MVNKVEYKKGKGWRWSFKLLR